jgi:hypothetical protein
VFVLVVVANDLDVDDLDVDDLDDDDLEDVLIGFIKKNCLLRLTAIPFIIAQ